MPKNRRTRGSRIFLKLPELEQSKSAVLNSLASLNSRRAYDYAIREFTHWCCSEPRLSFNRTVVTRYHMFLEQAHYSASTINLQLTAIRRLAFEATECGLSPESAAGIRRVRGVKQLGVRLGFWLATFLRQQSRRSWSDHLRARSEP